jgi:hypothetical protein
MNDVEVLHSVIGKTEFAWKSIHASVLSRRIHAIHTTSSKFKGTNTVLPLYFYKARAAGLKTSTELVGILAKASMPMHCFIMNVLQQQQDPGIRLQLWFGLFHGRPVTSE